MLINSLVFWLFFAIFILPYFTVWRTYAKGQNLWLLFASYFFYGWADWRMVPLLLAATIVFYVLGSWIKKYRESDSKKSFGLTVFGCVAGTCLLLYFKYLNFFIEQFANLFGLFGLNTNFSSFNIILPIGISFFTFKLISYVVEIHRGAIEPTEDFVTFATYIAFFPTIMSGPIDKPGAFIPQLAVARKANSDFVREGLKRVLWGMFLKMCIADKVSPYTDSVFNNYYHHNATTIIVAAILYSFQIYTDFCGYSEMAIGTGQILGIRVTENFNRPLFSSNVGDFWRRWHQSLMSWLKDYIYIPLGGSRCSKWKIFRNTMATFLVSGLWHGANWTFILWGGYHGVLVFIYRYLKKITAKFGFGNSFIYKYLSISFVFLLCTVGWIMFRASNVEQFSGIFAQMAHGFGSLFFSWALTAVLPIGILLFKEVKDEEGLNIHFLHSNRPWVETVSVSLLIVYVIYTGELNGAQFIYFQF
jgi:alginate O-acetyltransferase complex protein AlgI